MNVPWRELFSRAASQPRRYSAAVATYQHAVTMAAQLGALAGDTAARGRLAVHVVDRGSTDGTAGVLTAYSEKMPDLHWQRRRGLGRFAAWHDAVRAAIDDGRGNGAAALVLLHPRVRWLAGTLDVFDRAFASRPGVAAVTGDMLIDTGDAAPERAGLPAFALRALGRGCGFLGPVAAIDLAAADAALTDLEHMDALLALDQGVPADPGDFQWMFALELAARLPRRAFLHVHVPLCSGPVIDFSHPASQRARRIAAVRYALPRTLREVPLALALRAAK